VRAALERLILAVALAGLAGGALAQAVGEARLAVTGFRVEGENPLSQADTREILAPFKGEGVTLDGLQAAAAALEARLKEEGHAFLRVVLPPQEARGEIVLRVLAFRLGAVNVSGNKHFDTANILASLPALKPGASPNLREITRGQALANEHPAKQVSVTLEQGKAPDTVDAAVRVEESDPAQFFATLNNTGTRETGKWRLGVGAQHTNLFGRDHAVTATYTTSPDHTDDVKQYGIYYRAPFYALHGSLSAYYTRSDTNSGTVAEFFQVSGRGEFAGLRWTHRLLPLGAYGQMIEIGVEDRFFENDVAFAGVPIGVNVRSRPLLAHYEGRLDGAGYGVRGSIDFAHNLSGGGSNDEAAYSGNRAGATPEWEAWRFSLEGSRLLSGWVASARLRGQATRDALIPGEQFALGGASWVRGFPEREASGDSGYVANLEATTPEIAEGLRAAVFLDWGAVRLRDAAAGQSVRQGASSVGAGVRWRAGRNASVVFDLARVLDGAGATPAGRSFGHLALVIRF
jgi:hemolysin activation/secretion protein